MLVTRRRKHVQIIKIPDFCLDLKDFAEWWYELYSDYLSIFVFQEVIQNSFQAFLVSVFCWNSFDMQGTSFKPVMVDVAGELLVLHNIRFPCIISSILNCSDGQESNNEYHYDVIIAPVVTHLLIVKNCSIKESTQTFLFYIFLIQRIDANRSYNRNKRQVKSKFSKPSLEE